MHYVIYRSTEAGDMEIGSLPAMRTVDLLKEAARENVLKDIPSAIGESMCSVSLEYRDQCGSECGIEFLGRFGSEETDEEMLLQYIVQAIPN